MQKTQSKKISPHFITNLICDNQYRYELIFCRHKTENWVPHNLECVQLCSDGKKFNDVV